MAIKATGGLLCDLIRQENNGKYIAIGIYSSSIVVPFFPSILSFSLFTKLVGDSLGKHDILFRVMVGNDKNQEVSGDLTFENFKEDWIPIPLQPINFQVPSRLSVEQKMEDGSWNEFFSIDVARP